MKTEKKQTIRILLLAGLLIYAGLLCYAMFFAESFGRGALQENAVRVNLVPFQEIRRFLIYWEKVGLEYAVMNTAGNIFAFLPLGILCPVLFKPLRRWFRMAAVGFLVSLAIETLQLLTGAGVFDVDDLILNTIGTLLGYAVLQLLKRCFRNRRFEI